MRAHTRDPLPVPIASLAKKYSPMAGQADAQSFLKFPHLWIP